MKECQEFPIENSKGTRTMEENSPATVRYVELKYLSSTLSQTTNASIAKIAKNCYENCKNKNYSKSRTKMKARRLNHETC